MRVAEGIRIAQCLTCVYDVRLCRGKDEDSRGLCNRCQNIFEEGKHDKRACREGNQDEA